MSNSIRFLLPFAMLMVAVAARAGESRPIARGTEGLARVPIVMENAGPEEVVCSVALAHWYSLDLGRAAPGGRMEATLWSDPRDGTLVALNAEADQMPVGALWCGIAGRSWATRALIDVERRAGAVPKPIRLVCRGEGDRLACR